ncbi:hypothetical protein MTO96_027721 [Rhipicephalus appendiculatus]
MEQQNNVADSAAMRPFGPPPVFRGQADEDVEDWLRIYDRYSMALNWNDAQKARNLVFVLDDEARRWYSAVLRDATATQHLDSWAEWRDALLRDFAGEHIRDWAYIQLQERRQLPGGNSQAICIEHTTAVRPCKHLHDRVREGTLFDPRPPA